MEKSNKSTSLTGGSLLRRLALVAGTCLLLRAASSVLPAAPLPAGWPERALAMELPGFSQGRPELLPAALAMELPGTLPAAEPPGEAPDAPSDASVGDSESVLPAPAAVPTAGPAEPSPPPETREPAPAPETDLDALAGQLAIQNRTDYDIDAAALLRDPLPFEAEGARVLILHTHGSEAYTPDGADTYVPSDPYRTEDDRRNVVRVGDELEKVLTDRGIPVVHDRALYDYPSYNGSYTRAWEAISGYLARCPDIRVVIDLHRDALMDSSGTVYKTVADLGDTPCAQVMLIAGSDFSGLVHPEWRKNLSFAVKLQAEMTRNYPTLARPLDIAPYRYNQNATTGSLIAEIGTNGNTLQEAITAARYFGECLANILGA